MGHYYNDDISPNSSMEHGLVVELPDGKLFKLSDPNGRVVEMPNGSVVEMLDGQIVEMSNGQQLAMVDGNLVETRPAYIDIPEGDVVGHRILSEEELSRSKKRNAYAAPITSHADHPSSRSRQPPSASPPSASPAPMIGAGGEAGKKAAAASTSAVELEQVAQERERLREQERVTVEQEQRLSQRQRDVAEHDRALSVKQSQIAAQLAELKKEEEHVQRLRASLAHERSEAQKREAIAQKKEQEVLEALEKQRREAAQSREEFAHKEAEIREKERDLQRASSASTNVSSSLGAQKEEVDLTKSLQISAMEQIEAGRIHFSELSLGPLLGSGSFADVYRSEWRMPCAIKKMKGRLSKEQMTEFVREGEMMRALRHPGIVKLLGVCVENGSFYLVQEIVNGYGNLFDYLHKPPVNRLTYWQVLQIGHGISDAMTYLHEKSIVHRDLKPQNCLLVNDRGQVKLCDFGLARLKRTAFVETVSNTAGTPAYQAPEMLRDDPISEKVDLYGFGIMLWEMQTGKLPWSDKNYHQMIHTVAVRNERPPITPDIPRELAKQIELCWHPVPKSRPSFAELKKVFKHLSETVPCDLPTKQPQNRGSVQSLPWSASMEHTQSAFTHQHGGPTGQYKPPQKRYMQPAPSYPISAGHYNGNYQGW